MNKESEITKILSDRNNWVKTVTTLADVGTFQYQLKEETVIQQIVKLVSPPAKEAGEKELRGKILAYGISFANRYFNQLNISDSNEAKKEFIDSILALLTPYIDQLAKERGYVKLAKEQIPPTFYWETTQLFVQAKLKESEGK